MKRLFAVVFTIALMLSGVTLPRQASAGTEGVDATGWITSGTPVKENGGIRSRGWISSDVPANLKLTVYLQREVSPGSWTTVVSSGTWSTYNTILSATAVGSCVGGVYRTYSFANVNTNGYSAFSANVGIFC